MSTASLLTFGNSVNGAASTNLGIDGQGPMGNFVKSSRNGGVALRLSGQDDKATIPVYGRSASVEGTVDLSGKGMDSIQSVEVKVSTNPSPLSSTCEISSHHFIAVD